MREILEIELKGDGVEWVKGEGVFECTVSQWHCNLVDNHFIAGPLEIRSGHTGLQY